jgi:hypothetical protein
MKRSALLIYFPAVILMLHNPVSLSARDTYEERADLYLKGVPRNAPGGMGAIARLAGDGDVELAPLERDLYEIANHIGGIDFKIIAYVRLLYLYGDDPRLTPEIKKAIEESLLASKYWIDEPGRDDLCFWSENHQIAYHSDEYLVGALFPDKIFPHSGMTGREHMEKGRRLALRWLEWRARFGFSEWLSNVYYKVDLHSLVNLVDFAPDEEIRTRATMVMDLLALDLALNSYQGYMLCTHGRTYDQNILTPRHESVSHIYWQWWGERDFTEEMKQADRTGVSMATTTYRLPPAIYNIGIDRAVMENYQTNGIAPEEAPGLGLPYDDMETGMFFWGSGMYTHHYIADTTAKMWKDYDLYENKFFRGFARAAVNFSRIGVLDDILEHIPNASQAAFLEDSRIRTYRTPDYILSTVMDHRSGEVDGQSFVWIVAMGPDAKVFTTQPGAVFSNKTPGYWSGNAANPRAAQYRNVSVIVYNTPLRVTVGEKSRKFFTHAFFPRHAFDEVRDQGHWTFGRKGDGYLALYSRNKTKWVNKGDWAGRELKAGGLKNVWICEMGRASEDGAFDDFVKAVSSAKISHKGLSVTYDSPSLGPVEFGWTGPFEVDGRRVPLKREMRYDNPFVKAERFSQRIEIHAGGDSLVLDFEKGERNIQ